MNRDEKLELARMMIKHWVNSDEAYCDQIYDSASAAGGEYLSALGNDFAKFAVRFHEALIATESGKLEVKSDK